MRYVTQDDIKKINELYLQLKTYAAVSRATGFAPSTVKKYVIADFKKADESNFKRETGPMPIVTDFKDIFMIKDWKTLCELTKEEFDEIKELWEEITL